MPAFQGTENRRKDFFTYSKYISSNKRSDFGEETLHYRGPGGLFMQHWDSSFNKRSDFGEETLHYRDTRGLFTQHWNSSSNAQSDFGEETSSLDSLLSSLSIVNVPKDGSCLFWAASLAYLLSISGDQLEEACEKLFGNKSSISLAKEMMQDAKISKLPIPPPQASLTDLPRYWNSPFFSLIHRFRQQVVSYMRETLPADTLINNVPLSEHLYNMQNPSKYGEREEVQAISGLLDCKISVINSWGKNLEHIDTFGSGSTHLYLFLASNHYYFGLKKEAVRRLSPSLVTTDQVLERKSCNSNTKSTNVSNDLKNKPYSGLVKLKNIFNKPSKERIKIELEKMQELMRLEVKEKLEELSLLNELEELEYEIEDEKNKGSIITPFVQLLHPLNFLMPLSRLRKLTNWFNTTEPSVLTILKAKREKKRSELKALSKERMLLEKLSEHELESKNSLLGMLEEFKRQYLALQNMKESLVLKENEKIKCQIEQYNNRKTSDQEAKNRIKHYISELEKKVMQMREQQLHQAELSVPNEKNVKVEIKHREKLIEYLKNGMGKLESHDALINSRDMNPTALLKEEIAFQREYLGLTEPDFSYDELNKTSLDKNFLYLQKKWEKRDELVRYFAELPFVEGASDDDLLEDDSKVKDLCIKIITVGSLIGFFGMYFYGAYREYQNMITARLEREQTRRGDWKKGPWDFNKEWEEWKQNWEKLDNWNKWDWENDWDWRREWHWDWKKEWNAGEKYREKRLKEEEPSLWVKEWKTADEKQRKAICEAIRGDGIGDDRIINCEILGKELDTPAKIRRFKKGSCEVLAHCREYITLRKQKSDRNSGAS